MELWKELLLSAMPSKWILILTKNEKTSFAIIERKFFLTAVAFRARVCAADGSIFDGFRFGNSFSIVFAAFDKKETSIKILKPNIRPSSRDIVFFNFKAIIYFRAQISAFRIINTIKLNGEKSENWESPFVVVAAAEMRRVVMCIRRAPSESVENRMDLWPH